MAVRRRDVAIAKSRLGQMSAATPFLRLQCAILAMPLAAGAQAALQQGQACAQAVARDDLVAVGGTAVAPRQHAVGAGKPLVGRQVALVGANGPQGQAFAAGVERENASSFAGGVKTMLRAYDKCPKNNSASSLGCHAFPGMPAERQQPRQQNRQPRQQ